ncbi:radical SAM/SPASM domain-containing protein [Bradyrhizobium sp. WD16]|uniref:radical SAM/SPASM domain-containing protein n=1 Tax=Bradyrhizobium sp. WD16 TaxID=1521768 RepID=UPI0020A55713|nr:radical SAM protein [Bradyrhizobium sp. WD16]UTD29099.1 radical SAM protein [Bradyrhizobium sp. WD16]
MSDTQIIDHQGTEFGLRPAAAQFPMMLVLSFAYPCNALCPHCPYTNSNIRKEYRDAPYMSEAIFKKIADESGPHGAYLRISGGGEPMLHPKAAELLVHAKSRGCKIGLITNGSKFDEENSRALLAAGVDMIEFSVDACDVETYNRVRKGLDWDNLNEAVERMLRLRAELKSTSKIVCSAVHQKGVDIDAVEGYWVKGKGLDYIIKRKFLTWGANTELDSALSADPTAYLTAGETPCPFIFERLNIDSRGNVMVCGYDISANTRMGNVTTESIGEIWHGPGFKFYRDKHLAGKGNDVPLCRGCPDWKYRSWTHNYWKVLENAEAERVRKQGLSIHDDFQAIVED